MWYLENLSARNVCSFREVEYTLQQGVTTLIFGHNIDNENQKSNGSGKSTLLEVIALGITGSPLRKVRSEEIINDNAEDCCVGLTFGNRVTGERLHIERRIFRKGTSEVRCVCVRQGAEEIVPQASVDACNRYILNRLGITRDELFSSFILSRHRYQDFLSSSDKDKKEIINRFSNGVVVDEAIAQVEADLKPLREKLGEADLELAGLEGRIEMLTEQIRTEEESRQAKEKSRQQKVADIQATITRKRTEMRICKEEIARLHATIIDMDATDKQLQQFEESDTPLQESSRQVRELLAHVTSTDLTDWSRIVTIKNQEIEKMNTEIDKWTQIIAATAQKIARAKADHLAMSSEYNSFEQQAADQGKDFAEEMESLSERFTRATAQIEELRTRKRMTRAGIETLTAKLAGKVTCPACQHEFLVADADFDVAGAQTELERRKADIEAVKGSILDNEIEAEKVEMMMTHVRNECRNLEGLREQWRDRLAKGERAVQAAEYEMEGARFNMKRTEDFVAARTKEIGEIRRRLFDEAFEVLDAARKGNERCLTDNKERLRAAVCSIETLTQTITELENATGSDLIASLKDSLKSYRRKSGEVLQAKVALERRIKALQVQQQIFVQFKSYLANTKIDALSSMMNRILADLGSDIRVSMSGFTILKSGAIREKISVSLIRDGMDCGSFDKFSEGEKMRVNLSSIIAMQRLVNGNCDDGKGLDLLVIDELGDSLDETGLASTFSAINKLGLTALVVSHGLTHEGYPYKLQIVKENGESRIDVR